MTTRAAPGSQLSVGRLRVDAAKAIAKLREYQLADRTAWVLEAIRAAVAGGATRIELSGDANDVWLAWHGDAWAAGELPRLFDELVSPEPTSERHHLRLLAAAVNSALGMNPAYVDVYAIAADGSVRARYTPDVLDEPGADGESALRAVAAVAAAPPAGLAPSTGMLVHLRRRASLGMIAHLFWEREPPELWVARVACRDIAVPLHVGGAVLQRASQAHDVARLPLGDDVDGFVAIVDPGARRSSEHAAVLEVAERGVVLATYKIALGPAEPNAPVPLRLYVDAARMPTNASRSQVRRDAHPIAPAEQRAHALAHELVEALARTLGRDDTPEPARHAALALLAADDVWAAPRTAFLTFPVLGPVPLVRDATGAWHPIARAWSGLVYTGDAPLPAELAPWVGDILWIPPGDPAACLLGNRRPDAAATRRRIKWARRQQRAQRRFFEHAPRPPAIARTGDALDGGVLVRAKLGAALAGTCVPQTRFHGIAGELAVQPQRARGELVLLLDGREIERVWLDSAIGFEAVVDSGLLTPGDRYQGVARDDRFEAVVEAVRGGLVRAVEAIALGLTGATLPAGYDAGATMPPEVHTRIVRAGIALALELGLGLGPALVGAPAWRTQDGACVRIADIRAHKVVGVTPPGVVAVTPKDRLVLAGVSPELLAALAPGVHAVRYDVFRASGIDPRPLAGKLASAHRHALVIRRDGLAGAIAATRGASRVILHHLGTELDGRLYTPKLLPSCAIAVDSEAVVPDADWKVARDDAGLAARDYHAWELAFVRATALALAGHAPPELLGPPIEDFECDAARALCHAVSTRDAESVLDADVVAKLRGRRIVRALGRAGAVSLDDLAAAFPQAIPYVARSAVPVDGWHPIVADAVTAHAIGRMLGRDAVDGAVELEHRRRSRERDHRLAALRARPELALALPAGDPSVALAGNLLDARGVVGAGRERLEIEVRIERRAYTTIYRAEALPVLAVVELDLRHADDPLEGLSEVVASQLVTAALATVPALLEHVARTAPHLLADLGPMRALLARWLDRGNLDAGVRKILCGVPAFPTLRGGRGSIDRARRIPTLVTVSSWQGAFLAASEGERETVLDRDTILRVPVQAGELTDVITKLHGGDVLDITADVTKQQNERRMARGLIPVPALEHVPAELKCKLAELGEAGAALGHGELGLVEDVHSKLLVHARGILRRQLVLDVMPAVHLALEAPDLVGDAATAEPFTVIGQLRALADPDAGRPSDQAPSTLARQAQLLAVGLVRAIAGRSELPLAIRRNLVRAVLAGRIGPLDVAGVPLVRTLDGDWVAWEAVQQQIARFGDAWAVAAPTQDRPLAPDRRVFVIPGEDLALARGRFPLVDATRELELDAAARRNRERPRAASLELPPGVDVLAELALDGDGVAGPRGVVGVLVPAASERRGVYPHRELHRFDVMADPCAWPTVAVVDDARLQPDRTWSRPITGGAWHDVAAALRSASERALARVVEPPADALAVERVGPALHLEIPALRASKIQLRGALWLAGPPRPARPAVVRIVGTYRSEDYVPPSAIGMGGVLYVHTPDGWDRDTTLAAVCAHVHATLVKRLIGSAHDPDLVAAHVAHALALSRIQPADVPRMKFECFRPAPLDSVGLTAVVRGSGPHQILELTDDEVTGVLDDGSELSRVVIAQLGTRARHGTLAPPRPAPTANPIPAPARAKAEHAIQIVVDAVHARLVDLGVELPGVSIAAAREPIVRCDRGVRFAGDNPHLHAIANAMRARSPWAGLAVDALIAHTACVLNAARTDVNDATELRVIEQLLLG